MTYRTISPDQLGMLRILGFCESGSAVKGAVACDGTDDGLIKFADQSDGFRNVRGYEQAFKNIATLAGDPNAIDGDDLAKLNDPKVLAEVIAKDPVYTLAREKEVALVSGKKEVRSNDYHPNVPPRHFRRMMFYVQLALNLTTGATLKPNGLYDKVTESVLYPLQRKAGITNSDGIPVRGTLVGFRTLGMLVTRCRLTADDVIKSLEVSKAALSVGTKRPFYVEGAVYQHELDALDNIAKAFKWLGYLDENVGVSTGKNKLAVALADNFEGAQVVGPNVLGMVIDRVRESM